jgi:hypothetical protein
MNRFNPLLRTPRSAFRVETAPRSALRVETGRRTGIASAVMQSHLDSAPNAGAKGQAQYHTPTAWAQVLGLALPRYRNTIVDLNCGNGQLLAGVAGDSTHHLLGCDIEPPDRESTLEWSATINDRRVTADVTQFYPLLHEIEFEADLFALNPPWDLHWYRDRLESLAYSSCNAVAMAFQEHDGRTAKETIDSTVATLCMALDRCSVYGEGYLIANNATLERLIFAPDAPHKELADHVWARLAIEGNICQVRNAERGTRKEFHTGVIYFARDHTAGSRGCRMFNGDQDVIGAVSGYCEQLFKNRLDLRKGAWTTPNQHTNGTNDLWCAAAAEWRVRNNAARVTDNPWNIWLGHDGTILTNLSVFDELVQVKKAEAVQLHQLNGRHPMQMVLQKNDRKNLERATLGGSPWRVAPAVVDAVRQALADYEAVRSPLVPLNEIQRLGFLDDNDDILCLKTFGPFAAGARYPIRTETLAYRRVGTKMNLVGQLDDVQWEGSELAIYIGEHLFMDARLRGNDVRLSIEDEAAEEALRMPVQAGTLTPQRNCPIEFTLQQLVEHFEIPDVPDVATRNPEGYQHNLDLLAEIEQIVNA